MYSNIKDEELESIFLELLYSKIKDINLETNNIVYKKRKKAIVCIRK